MSTSATSAPTPAAQQRLVPCGRCGTFMQGEPMRLRGLEVCPPCAMLLVKDTSLYAYVPLNVVGMLVSFMLAGLMSALNWKRLGNPRRMWISIGVTLLGVGWTYPKLFRLSALGLNMPEPETARPLVSFIQSLPFLVDLGVHVVATVVATWGLKTPCQEHVRAGGARSSVLLPLGLYLGPLIVWGLFSDITRR